jgi:heme-degrading monooxygenase HmoA
LASVVFINCFEVPVGREDEFLALWMEVNDHMQCQEGYLAHRLHRALTPEARFRFVNVAEWASAEHWAAAHDERFRRIIGQPAWHGFATVPALFEPVHEGRA